MIGNFTSDHFKMLREWGEQKRDDSIVEQQGVYEELKKAYTVTEAWAVAVKNELFPDGDVKAHKAPLKMGGQSFKAYQWAKIYPSLKSPKQLSYVVGISGEGFFVKIETYGVAPKSVQGERYDALKRESRIEATLSESDGLAKPFSELVEWSVEAIRSFTFSYDEVVAMLDLGKDQLSDAASGSSEDFELNVPNEIIRQPFNRIYYGPPGTGKTYELSRLLKRDYEQGISGRQNADSIQRYSFVTFHQSYGYEEFVEGLRPVLGDGFESSDIQYEVRAGVFKELCRRARLAPDQRFAMVIDEINRGNISKIFGELITLIELDKREGAENAVSVILPYSGERFSVPDNIDFVGAMNTADRSLALLDTALRRRFDFVPLLPDSRDISGSPLFGLRVTSGEKTIDIPRLLDAVNQRIEALYDRDHCIGHAYFMGLGKVDDGDERLFALAQVFRNRIIPLLEEYFFEDWKKIRLVLADNQKPESAQFILESAGHEDDLARLFGSDHGLDAYATNRQYSVQKSALDSPDAYIGIYQTLTV